MFRENNIAKMEVSNGEQEEKGRQDWRQGWRESRTKGSPRGRQDSGEGGVEARQR